MGHWSWDAVFYHIYPLGFCGAPERNDFASSPVPRLEKVHGWLDHLQALGVTALYLGPVFESSGHGYDTADFGRVDRRLGDNQTLARLSRTLHERGLKLVLDGVFNHVGRDFWAFRDVRERLRGSAYCDWFHGLRFEGRSRHGDPFAYDGWKDHYELVELNHQNEAVRQHIFQAIARWIDEFAIDGLRLDAADCIAPGFLAALATFCRRQRADFWLLGEVIHGDYRKWANPAMLDSVTNYECYKGLYSSHVDKNYFEIAYAFNRQFGEGGLYGGLPLYAFADNHDVNRVASNLTNPAHLYPLHILLFTMPGVPSVYYGSEWGIEGQRTSASDRDLRPCLDLDVVSRDSPQRDLAETIGRLAHIRQQQRMLRYGGYAQLHVGHEQMAFLRRADSESAVVVVNAADKPASLKLTVPLSDGVRLIDALNPGEEFVVQKGQISPVVMPCWGRILTTVL